MFRYRKISINGWRGIAHRDVTHNEILVILSDTSKEVKINKDKFSKGMRNPILRENGWCKFYHHHSWNEAKKLWAIANALWGKGRDLCPIPLMILHFTPITIILFKKPPLQTKLLKDALRLHPTEEILPPVSILIHRLATIGDISNEITPNDIALSKDSFGKWYASLLNPEHFSPRIDPLPISLVERRALAKKIVSQF